MNWSTGCVVRLGTRPVGLVVVVYRMKRSTDWSRPDEMVDRLEPEEW